MEKKTPSPLRKVRSNFTAPKLDGRTRLAKQIEARRQELIEAVGDPSPMQLSIIDRIPFMEWYACEIERRIVGGDNVDGYTAQYLAWVNTIRRSLRVLGMDMDEPENNDPLSFLEDGEE